MYSYDSEDFGERFAILVLFILEFGRAGKRVVAAQKIGTPSRVPLYLWARTVVEIRNRPKDVAAPVRAGKVRKGIPIAIGSKKMEKKQKKVNCDSYRKRNKEKVERSKRENL